MRLVLYMFLAWDHTVNGHAPSLHAVRAEAALVDVLPRSYARCRATAT